MPDQNTPLTLRDGVKQYIVYLYARRGWCMEYWLNVGVLCHLLDFAGDIPLSMVKEGAMMRYLSVILSEQNLVPLADTRRRSQALQSLWRWMLINGLVTFSGDGPITSSGDSQPHLPFL